MDGYVISVKNNTLYVSDCGLTLNTRSFGSKGSKVGRGTKDTKNTKGTKDIKGTDNGSSNSVGGKENVGFSISDDVAGGTNDIGIDGMDTIGDVESTVYSRAINDETVDDTRILDSTLFAEVLGDFLVEVFKSNLEKKPLIFLIEPEDIVTSFLHENKNIDNLDKYLLDEVKKQLAKKGLTVDDVYFSYQKIAPFIYQFVAVKKDQFESFLEVAGNLDYSVGLIVSWAHLFSKTISKKTKNTALVTLDEDGEGRNSSDPGKGSIILSKFNGVYKIKEFMGSGEGTNDGLEKAVVNSIKGENVDGVYIFRRREDEEGIKNNKDEKDEDIGDIGESVSFKNENSINEISFENTHQLFKKSIKDSYKTSQLNLLNLLPLPVKKQSRALVYSGSALFVFLIFVGALFGFRSMNNGSDKSEVLGGSGNAENSVENSNAGVSGSSGDDRSSEDKENDESKGDKVGGGKIEDSKIDRRGEKDSGNLDKNGGDTENGSSDEGNLIDKVDLKKEYLSIRIENATNIAGLAGRTRDHLSSSGYDDIVGIGDSEKSGMVKTLVQFTPEFGVYEDILLEDLRKMYDLIEVKKDLDEGLGYDVLITVGTDKE